MALISQIQKLDVSPSESLVIKLHCLLTEVHLFTCPIQLNLAHHFSIDPTAVVDSIEYLVESVVTGEVRLTVSSPGAYGTGVVYGGSVTGGSVVVNDSSMVVTGLDYRQTHSVSVTASSSQCSGLVGTTPVEATFTTES